MERKFSGIPHEVVLELLTGNSRKYCSIRRWKCSGIQTGIFGQKESAPRTREFCFITFVASFFFFPFQDLLEFPPPLNSLLSVVKGEKWRRIRSALSPSFSALKMKRMVPLMNQACDTFMTKLEKVADYEESVDIHE